MTEKILHSTIKLRGVPKEKSIRLTKDQQTIYYSNGRRKCVLRNIEILPSPNPYNFMKLSLNVEQNDRSDETVIKVYLNVDLKKLLSTISSPFSLKNRKNFFSIMQRCYWEFIFTNSFETIKSKNIFDNCLEVKDWVKSVEDRTDTEYLVYPPNFVKLGSIGLNVKEFRFIRSTDPMKNVRIRGGVLVDKSDDSWIRQFENVIGQENSEDYNWRLNKNGLNGGTLVLVAHHMCKTVYNLMATKCKAVLIYDRRSHSSQTYEDLLAADLVIVSINYFKSKGYGKIWDEYKLPDKSLSDIYELLMDEIDPKNMYDVKLPIFGLIKWHRLILDNDDEELTDDIFTTLESTYRWLRVSKIDAKNDILPFICYLTMQPDMYTPLHDQYGDVYIPEGIIKINQGEEEVKVRYSKVLVDMTEEEQKVYRIVGTCGFLDTCCWIKQKSVLPKLKSQVKNQIKQLESKNKGKLKKEDIEEIKKQIENKKMLLKYIPGIFKQKDSCKICLEERDSMKSVTQCGHVFCTECLLKCLEYSKKCPTCRESVETVYQVSTNGYNSKLKCLTKMVRKDRSVICCKDDKTMSYVFSHLKDCLKLEGTTNKKMNIVNSFNNDDSKVLVTLNKDIKFINCTRADKIVCYNTTVDQDTVIKNVITLSYS